MIAMGLVGANGFEPSTSWSRTSLEQTKSVELTAFACAFPPLIRATWATKYRWPQSRPTCLGTLLPGIFPQIACPSYSEVKRFQRHLATVTFERFSQVRRILAGADSALRTGHDPPIDLGVTTFRRRSICRPDAGVPGLFGCGRANTDRSRR